MAFTVTTYKSEDDLAAAILATVTTLKDESQLAEYLETLPPASIFDILGKGYYFTVILTPEVANISLRLVAKGAFFTVILET